MGRIFTIVTIGLVSAGLLLSPMTGRHGVAAGLASDAQAGFTAILQRSEKWPRLADTYTDRRDTITVATLVYANENCIRIVSGFGDSSLWGKNSGLARLVPHRGVDIPGGDIPVLAAADGTVIIAGGLEAGPNDPYQRIAILHGPMREGRFRGLYVISSYGHLKAGSLRVKDKQSVRRGAALGLSGQTGYSRDVSHLGFDTFLVANEHYEIYDTRFGRAYRPTDARISIDPNLLWFGNSDADIDAALKGGVKLRVPSFEPGGDYGVSLLFTYPPPQVFPGNKTRTSTPDDRNRRKIRAEDKPPVPLTAIG